MALHFDERPVDDMPVHTDDLPMTPQRDRRIPARVWVEAPAELLAALGVVYVAFRKGREAWAGDTCC